MPGPGVCPDAIRSARDRVVSHSLFAGSPRLSRFLTYVVEETLASRGDQIKEYTIGTAVYERGAEFDPKTDAIVRVEAGRLRAKLRRYYDSEGAAEAVRIELPPGSYVPRFSGADQEQEPAHEPGPVRNRRSVIRPHWIGAAVIASALSLFGGYQLLRSSDPAFSIAIRQFTNLTGDAALNNAATSLAEQTAVELAGDPGILVNRLPVDAVSPKTGTILSGSLSAGDGEYSLTVHLDAAGGRQLWAGTLHRGDLTPAQFRDAAAALVARTLNRLYGGRSLAEIERRARHNPAAEELFVRGHQEWLTQTRHGIDGAISFYGQALDRDPQFADAWAEMAAAKLLRMNMVTDPAEQARCSRDAQAAAEKALSIDARVAEAHTRLGNIYLHQRADFVAAERELRLAAELNPGADASTRWLAIAASFRGHSDLARRELQYGLMLNPGSEVMLTEMARLDFETGHLDRAARLTGRALERHPNYGPAHFLLALIRDRQGDERGAREEFRACSATRGWPFDCRASLARLERPEPGGISADFISQFPRHYSRALLHLAAGEREAAIQEVQSGFESREPDIHYVCLDPQFTDVLSGSHLAFCGSSR